MRTPLYIALALVLAGCAKAPDRLESPSMTIRAHARDGKAAFTLTLAAALHNGTSDTVFLDYRARIVFRDPGKDVKETVATVLTLKVGSLYPFATAPVRIEVTGSAEEFAPLFAVFGIPPDEVVKAGSAEDIEIGDELIGLENITYRTADIHTLIKERQNEKNK
ncbi:MAG: hypothetical protein EPN93_11970 [Spirochaetes bacterium]|nr:MAG: hypothetical protein EPN93_11970 [Spirochaetota bacterium]